MQGTISLANAPKALVNWIRKQKRCLTRSPKIPDVDVFGASWRVWWTGLQPEWRRKSRRGGNTWPLKRTPFPAHEEWLELRYRGQDGLGLVLLSLGWWATCVQSSKDRKGWNSAVDDVLWVLQHLQQA